MKESERVTYRYFVSAEEGEAAAMDEMGADERDGHCDGLCRQLIECGMRGELVAGG